MTPAGGRTTPPPSLRYTPPDPSKLKVSPPWLPVVMGVLLAAGSLLIIVNYLDLLPGGANNAYLLVGLGLITVGFVVATQWR